MIYIVRHGETNWNKEERCQGHSNIPLNETGIKQAEEIKEKLKDVVFDKVFCSPLDRTKSTAKIITDHELIIDDRLIERCNGEFEGKLNEYMKNMKAMEGYKDEDYGVETPAELQARADSFMNEILSKYKGQNILIVTHGGITINLRVNLEGPVDDARKYLLGNCEVFIYNNN